LVIGSLSALGGAGKIYDEKGRREAASFGRQHHASDKGFYNLENIQKATLEHAEPPSNELTERVREQFRNRGLSVF
jgi:hypothetical protein